MRDTAWPVLIREMTLEDCERLAALREDPHLAIDPRLELGGRLTRAWVVCEGDGAPALGYALGWWVIDELQLLALGVLGSERRRGLGGRLLEHVLSTTAAAGGRRVLLEVAASNTAGRELYERAGFQVFNVRPKYYSPSGDDALEMEFVVGR